MATDIPDDRRRRVEMLLGIASPTPSSPVDLGPVPGDPTAVAAAVDADRLVAHVRTLAVGPRHPWSDLAATRAAASYVEEQLRSRGAAPAALDVTHDGVTLPALWSTVPGAPHDEGDGARRTVVLVAHYDTVASSPGADDNASGVAGLLEIARVLPRDLLAADVVLAAVPFEERPGDLAGSAALAALLTGDPGLDVVAAVSAEMLGCSTVPRVTGDTGEDLLLIGYPGTDTLVDLLVAAAGAWSPGRVRGLAVPRHVPEIDRSDHASFHRRGVPAVMATDGAEFRNRHYHQPSDTTETVDPTFLAGSTASLAVGLMALATLPLPEPTAG